MVGSKIIQKTFGMKVNNILLVLFLFLLAGCVSTQYVMVDPSDSTKLVRIERRIVYTDIYNYPIPYYYNNYGGFLYNPLIIHTPLRKPQIRIQPPHRNYNPPRFRK